MSTFHILNGDALKERFPKSIQGHLIVFRECLVFGPLASSSLDDLFLARASFIEEVFEGADYQKEVIPELEKITTIPAESEVYCWFEEDLFCQVNFWCTIALLAKNQHHIKLVLPETNLEYGFGGCNDEGLIRAFNQAGSLEQNQIDVLTQLWTLFALDKPDDALSLAKTQHLALPFLLPAIEAWKDSIPSKNKLGLPERALLEISQDPEKDSFPKIFRAFHHQYPIYGYGDAIVKILWDKVKPKDF